MGNLWLYGIGFAAALLIALVMTPLVKRFAFWVGAVDAPNERKVHTRIMARLGGLAIFIAFAAACFIVLPAIDEIYRNAAWGLLAGGAIIVLTGALDDRFQLPPKLKLLGIVIAATVVVYGFGLKIDLVNVPFGGRTLDLTMVSIPLTILYLVAVTNAINLIDGLDGLAGGVSAISTGTILIMAALMGGVTGSTVIMLASALLGGIIGFLFFNFYPAKIFMGDSGALFLGFSIATLSILGFKQTTVVSFIIPLLIIGVPLSDTFFAIVRRWLNKKPIFLPDKGHLHHCLLQMGFSHRKTVLIIYGISAFFGACAVLLSQASLWLTIVAMAVILVVIEIGAEAIGIFSKRKPLIGLVQRMRTKSSSHSI